MWRLLHNKYTLLTSFGVNIVRNGNIIQYLCHYGDVGKGLFITFVAKLY